MKPARSPRFQSAALRASIAAISTCGFPDAACGAAQATNATVAAHQVQRATRIASPFDSWEATNVPRERLEQMARAIRTALPRCDVEECYRRRFFAAFFRFFPPFFAFAFGRRFAAFFFALGLAAFFFLAGFGAPIGSPIIGAGAGGVGGAGGYIGSIIPEPGQLLSEKSVGWSIE